MSSFFWAFWKKGNVFHADGLPFKAKMSIKSPLTPFQNIVRRSFVVENAFRALLHETPAVLQFERTIVRH